MIMCITCCNSKDTFDSSDFEMINEEASWGLQQHGPWWQEASVVAEQYKKLQLQINQADGGQPVVCWP